jgi:hypothetical protein
MKEQTIVSQQAQDQTSVRPINTGLLGHLVPPSYCFQSEKNTSTSQRIIYAETISVIRHVMAVATIYRYFVSNSCQQLSIEDWNENLNNSQSVHLKGNKVLLSSRIGD